MPLSHKPKVFPFILLVKRDNLDVTEVKIRQSEGKYGLMGILAFVTVNFLRFPGCTFLAPVSD